jgi:hypothetical protein
MLQELTHMDRITQLQDEIQNVCSLHYPRSKQTHPTNRVSTALDYNGEQHKLPHQ